MDWGNDGREDGIEKGWFGGDPIVFPLLDPWSDSLGLWRGMDLHWVGSQAPCPSLGGSWEVPWFPPPKPCSHGREKGVKGRLGVVREEEQ